MRKLFLAAFWLLFGSCIDGCVAMRGVRDDAVMLTYRIEGKQLVAIKTPCSNFPKKPALIMEFMRLGDVGKFAIVCDDQCNCKVVRRTPNMKIQQPPSESGICQ